MPLIPDEVINEIAARADLVEIVLGYVPVLACLLCLKSTKVVPDQGPGPSCSDPITLGLLMLAFSSQ